MLDLAACANKLSGVFSGYRLKVSHTISAVHDQMQNEKCPVARMTHQLYLTWHNCKFSISLVIWICKTVMSSDKPDISIPRTQTVRVAARIPVKHLYLSLGNM